MVKGSNVAQTLQKNRAAILGLSAKYGASNVRVFGSVARGDFSKDSDIDLLVDLEPGRSLFDLGGLLIDLQNLLDCKVDIGTTRMLKDSIKDQVLKRSNSTMSKVAATSWLKDILKAIDKIEPYPQYIKGRKGYDKDKYYRDVVHLNIERICEEQSIYVMSTLNLEDGATIDEFLKWFPGIDREQILAVLRFTEKSLLTAT